MTSSGFPLSTVTSKPDDEIEISLDNYNSLSTRINKNGANCKIGDIVTCSMRKNKEQLFGIIKSKNKSCICVDLLKSTIYNHMILLNKTRKVDNVCHNKLNYTRKLMIINDNNAST